MGKTPITHRFTSTKVVSPVLSPQAFVDQKSENFIGVAVVNHLFQGAGGSLLRAVEGGEPREQGRAGPLHEPVHVGAQVLEENARRVYGFAADGGAVGSDLQSERKTLAGLLTRTGVGGGGAEGVLQVPRC